MYTKTSRDNTNGLSVYTMVKGASENSIWSNITHQKTGEIKRGSFKRVDIGELEETEGDG